MNLRTLTAKLKAFFSAAKALALGLFFKSRRGVEWHRLTHDRYPWIVALLSLMMLFVMIRIVFFILSPDGMRRWLDKSIPHDIAPSSQCVARSMLVMVVPWR